MGCKEVELRHDSGGPFAPTYYMQGPGENIFLFNFKTVMKEKNKGEKEWKHIKNGKKDIG